MTKDQPESIDDTDDNERLASSAESFDLGAIGARLDRLWSAPDAQAATFASGTSIGQMVAQYKIRAVLGSGAFGIVYLADDTLENRPVALKLPRPEVLADPNKLAQFQKESAVVAKLDHEGIVKVLDSGVDGPIPFIVSQWCDGPNLAAWLESQTELPQWQQSVQLIAKVALAIDHAHRQGVEHRDLKPANILLARSLGADSDARSLASFTPQVTDFGLAKLIDPVVSRSRSSLLVGTPVYMAPEQIGDADPSGRPSTSVGTADVYSLGVILFELLTGRFPIQGDNYFSMLQNIRSGSPHRLQQFRSDLPRGLSAICKTCLSQNPDARYATGKDLAADCQRLLSGESPKGKSLNPIRKFSYWHRNQNWLKIAGAYSLFYCFLLITWFGTTAIGFAYFSVVPRESYVAMIPAAIAVFVGSLLVPGVLAALCIRGHLWAAWAATLVNCPKIISAMFGMGGNPLSFREYYQNYSPYLCFTVHLFIFVACASQMLLYLFAIMAPRKKRRFA